MFLQVHEISFYDLALGGWPIDGFVGSKNAQADVVQSSTETPAFGDVFLYRDITVPQFAAREAEILHNLRNDGFVDKIFKPCPVRVSKFKLVIICQQPQEEERC